ncbi:MAG TPA: tetratricopeptide repeat protein [Acidobacteriota bacterium]|nr:tetratricopeptide repeat protein [Acidobacteriota bacterium]
MTSATGILIMAVWFGHSHHAHLSPPSATGSVVSAHVLQDISAAEQAARERFIDALRLAEQGRLDEALEAAVEALSLDDNNADGLNLIGQLYEQMDRGSEAEQAYRGASKADPDWSTPYRNLGSLYVARSQPSLALAPLTRAADLAPDDPLAHALLASVLRATGRPREAVATFRRAWELDPDSVQLAIDIAMTQMEAGDHPGAIATAEQATDRAPESPLAARLLARTLNASELVDDLVRAPAAYRRAIGLDPGRGDLWLGLGAAYDQLALRAQAEEAYRRAIELGLDTPQVRYELGRILSRQSQFASALEQYAHAIATDANFAPAYYARGEALFELNRAEEALADFEHAIRMSPGDPDPVLAAVQVYMVRGALESSERLLSDIASTATRRRPEIAVAIGRLRLRQDRNEEVVEVLAPVLDDASELIEARYLSGQALLKLGRIDEGRAMLSEYQRLFNAERGREVELLRVGIMGRAQIYVLRGRVYAHEGRFKLALEQLQSAAELAPDNPEVWQALAELHDGRGDSQAAAEARQRAKALRDAGGPS